MRNSFQFPALRFFAWALAARNRGRDALNVVSVAIDSAHGCTENAEDIARRCK